jgi:ABC-2 type transport system permease protein
MTWVALVVAAILIAVSIWRRRHPRARRPVAAGPDLAGVGGVVGLVAAREIRERTRSRVFQVGTAVIILAVATAIIVPVLRRGQRHPARIGVVGGLSDPLRGTVIAQGAGIGVPVTLVPEANVADAEADLRSRHVALVIVDGRRLIVLRAPGPTDTSRPALLIRGVAGAVSVQAGLEAAGVPPEQAAALAHAPPLPITSLLAARRDQTARVTAVYGLILMFVLLSQYGTWILLGVVEEKSSRVVEVLLSTVRPGQLLTGKVIGIGAVAFAQGTLLVAVALGLAEAVGSALVRGTAPLVVFCVLVWLVLGYAFYCWVYAAAGSLAERQEHVQSLAFPLQLPILFGYIVSLSAVGSTDPSTLLRVLAYLPPTAPFAMTVLVAIGRVTWWQFAVSAVITVASTVAVARLAALVYRRAVLLTGRRVRIREVFQGATA